MVRKRTKGIRLTGRFQRPRNSKELEQSPQIAILPMSTYLSLESIGLAMSPPLVLFLFFCIVLFNQSVVIACNGIPKQARSANQPAKDDGSDQPSAPAGKRCSMQLNNATKQLGQKRNIQCILEGTKRDRNETEHLLKSHRTSFWSRAVGLACH
jgi:hypothetical protein